MQSEAILQALFPSGHAIRPGAHNTAHGSAALPGGREVAVVGIGGAAPLGIEAAILLSGHVLELLRAGGGVPLVFLVDTASQRMSRRDELLGLNEYLAHLCKCLALAAAQGHRTVGILHGAAAAGAFIATALATDTLVTVPGADPSVMDLPSIARVTKLPLETVQSMSEQTPIFAPGIAPLTATGAVTCHWDDPRQFASLLEALLDEPISSDQRDRLGGVRGGRTRAAEVARRVQEAMRAGV